MYVDVHTSYIFIYFYTLWILQDVSKFFDMFSSAKSSTVQYSFLPFFSSGEFSLFMRNYFIITYIEDIISLNYLLIKTIWNSFDIFPYINKMIKIVNILSNSWFTYNRRIAPSFLLLRSLIERSTRWSTRPIQHD